MVNCLAKYGFSVIWSPEVYSCETFIGSETASPGIPSCTDFSNDTRNVHETLKIYETVFIQC